RHGRGEGAYVEVALDLVARHQVEPAPKSDGKAEAAPNRLRDEGERELPLVGEARRQVDAVADHRRLGEPERGDRGDSRLRLGPAEDEAVGELVVELQALQPAEEIEVGEVRHQPKLLVALLDAGADAQ